MKETALRLLEDLETQLKEIELAKKETIEHVEDSIRKTISVLETLKTNFVKYKFESKKDEIYFFRDIKPQFVSKLIYYNEIYNIMTNKPFGGNKTLRKYYTGELAKLKSFYTENVEFFKYYRNGNTYLDNKYFVRGRYDIKLTLDSFYFQADSRFSTSHDFKVAKIMANDLIQSYLEIEIAKIENKAPLFNLTERQVQKWTGTKIALIELVYALHAEGVFNNGASDLKETAKFFEEVFDVDLGQFHRTFFEMRARKADRTKFLNSLRDTLVRRMDEVDE
ncbi:RteC domain-containing protein [Flavobacterium phycosphaerae]|uniref:RteC domain-containing protein n=1 Tax=Flavobacterium phycosphaerae TaxID=2697515 RepID=UPI00138B0928|nr:RteC domain-containing protein [Flavobacterium phycosphaerae]